MLSYVWSMILCMQQNFWQINWTTKHPLIDGERTENRDSDLAAYLRCRFHRRYGCRVYMGIGRLAVD
jgi:hypothetical protein